MRLFALLLPSVVSLCSALVIPDQRVFESSAEIHFVYEGSDTPELIGANTCSQIEQIDVESGWDVLAAVAKSSHETLTDLVLNSPGIGPSPGERAEVLHDVDEGDDEGDDEELSQANLPEQSCPENHTIWELISQNASTARLAELLSNEDDLIDLLNDTESVHTLFAPSNSSLERFLGGRPSRSTLRQIEHYHIAPGFIPTGGLKRHRTIPTALKASSLGKHVPQRIVVNLRQDQIVLNRLSRVVAGDIVVPFPKHIFRVISFFKLLQPGQILSKQVFHGDIIANNGIIHQISHPLLPPSNTSTILNTLPAHFSTFVHGIQVTNLASHPWKHHRVGGTTFAPTNTAFQRLGPRLNTFLFSPQGGKCLRALLEYHLVLDRTLYSDAFNDVHGRVDEFGSRGEGDVVVHVELPTLLRRKISVDVARRGGDAVVRLNGFYEVVTLGLVAADGVVHVLDEVLIPPRRIGEKVKEEGLTGEALQDWLGDCDKVEI